MVQMNLFPGQECRRGEQTCGPGRGQEGEGGTKWQVGTVTSLFVRGDRYKMSFSP